MSADDSARDLDVLVFLSEVADAYEQLIELSRAVREVPRVVKVDHGLQIRRYSRGPTIEASVDAELRDGTAAAWTLDVWADSAGEWHVEAAYRVHGVLGEDVLHRRHQVVSGEAFRAAIRQVVSELVAVPLAAETRAIDSTDSESSPADR